jgi:hypothetical protein
MDCWSVSSPYILANPQWQYLPSDSRELAIYSNWARVESWLRAFSLKRNEAVFIKQAKYIAHAIESQSGFRI